MEKRNPTWSGAMPTESQEQQWLMAWVKLESARRPELQLLYHIPNEGQRSRATGARMRAEGLKRGVPDLCLPVPRGGYHGLYIELTRRSGGRVSDDQRGWIEALARMGYRAEICQGWQAAAEMIEAYLKGSAKGATSDS